LKIAVYTVVTGKNYKLKEFKPESNLNYFCFTNQKIKSKSWNILPIDEKLSDKKLSRKVKILAHKYLPDYNVTLYVDSKFKPIKDTYSFIVGNLSHDFILMKHHKRNCIYDEAKKCLELKLDSEETINSQINRYRSCGFPTKFGLLAPGIMIRKNLPIVNALMEEWWGEVKIGSYRDMISLPFVLMKFPNIQVKQIDFRKNYKRFK